MSFFGKKISSEVKKEIIMRLVLIFVSGTLLAFVAGFSFAWFSRSSNTSNTGMGIVVRTENYDLIIKRTHEYDKVYNDETKIGYQDVWNSTNKTGIKTTLESEGYAWDSASGKSSTSDPEVTVGLSMEIDNELLFDKNRYLMPGSYGTVTFYIRPREGFTGTVSMSIEPGAFIRHVETVNDTEVTTLVPVTNKQVLYLLRGHILFFTGRDVADYVHSDGVHTEDYKHYIYSGQITDGEFEYDIGAHSPESVDVNSDGIADYTGCYEVKLYWEWPLTYYDIVEHVESSGLGPRGERFPVEMADYISENKKFNDRDPEDDNYSYFFGKNLDSENLKSLSDGYNDGDQTIGAGADFFVLYLTVGN